MGNYTLEREKLKSINRPWQGSSVGWHVVPIHQGCGISLWSGHIQASANEQVQQQTDVSQSLSSYLYFKSFFLKEHKHRKD